MGKLVQIKVDEIDIALQGLRRQYFVGDLKQPQMLEFIRDKRVEMGISSYNEDSIEPAHRHSDATEYLFILEGHTQYLNVETGEVYDLKKGDFFAIFPDTTYAQRIKAGTSLVFIKLPSINDKEVTKSQNADEWLKEKWD